MKARYKREELFIEVDLPEPFSEDKLRELFIRGKNGEKDAIDEIIIHNIRLVMSRVFGKFYTVEYDKEDLVSIGNIGLIKAVNTFDITKNAKFNCYAVRCIDNEILLFLRDIKKHKYVESIDEPLSYLSDDIVTYMECIKDDIDLEDEYLENELYLFLNKIVLELPEIDREIIMMFYGFNNDKIFLQKEIGERFDFTQSNVSRRIGDNLKKIRRSLENSGLIEKKKMKILKK